MSDTPNCPVCDDTVDPIDENDYFPFCSRRCKRVDLGRWMGENYSIPLTPQTSDRALGPEDADAPDESD